jgi:hypothetical protein
MSSNKQRFENRENDLEEALADLVPKSKPEQLIMTMMTRAKYLVGMMDAQTLCEATKSEAFEELKELFNSIRD